MSRTFNEEAIIMTIKMVNKREVTTYMSVHQIVPLLADLLD